jgi:hypothetical protein
VTVDPNLFRPLTEVVKLNRLEYPQEWQPIEGKEEIPVRVVQDRGELARRLLGAGRGFAPERDSVAELIQERAAEG